MIELCLPDDDSRFRLNNDGELLSAKDEGATFGFTTTASNGGKFDLVVNGLITLVVRCMIILMTILILLCLSSVEIKPTLARGTSISGLKLGVWLIIIVLMVLLYNLLIGG